MSAAPAETGVRDRNRQQLERVDRELAAAVPMKTGEGGALQIVPSNMDQAMEFAVMMSKAGDMIRPQFRSNPGACLAISMFAWRVGMDPFVVSNKAYITVNTKGGGHVTQVAYEAQLINAIINLRAPLAKRLRATYSGAGQTRRITIIGYIQGEDEPLEYESPEVKDIKVQNSPLWQADRDQQLWYYGVRAWARRHFPEITMGAYTREEIEEGLSDPEVVTLSPEQRAEARAARPQRGGQGADDVVDAEVEETGTGEPPAAGLDIQFPDGEVREFTDPADFAEAFSRAMTDLAKAGDRRAFDGFWDTNSGMLATLRQTPDGTREADELTAEYQDLEADLTKREAAARKAAQQPAEEAPAAEKKPAEATTQSTGAAEKTTRQATEPTKSSGKSTDGTAPKQDARPQPWIFKPIGGREKPVTVAGGQEFFDAMLKAIKAEGYAPSRVSAFAFKLNEAGMKRLDQVEPELHAGLLQACREAGCEI